MININTSSHQPSNNPSFNNTQSFNTTTKHVNFAINEEQANLSYSNNSSKDKIDQHRLQNSKREFQIRRPNKRSKERGLKSPSEFTTGAKSVASLFTSNSGKTNKSAPTGTSHSLSESPKRQIKIKKDLVMHKKSNKGSKNKKKLRANSSNGL